MSLASFRPELRGTPEAVDAIAYVRKHPPLSLAARPGYAVLWAAAIGLMPTWSRAELGLPNRPLVRPHTRARRRPYRNGRVEVGQQADRAASA